MICLTLSWGIVDHSEWSQLDNPFITEPIPSRGSSRKFAVWGYIIIRQLSSLQTLIMIHTRTLDYSKGFDQKWKVNYFKHIRVFSEYDQWTATPYNIRYDTCVQFFCHASSCGDFFSVSVQDKVRSWSHIHTDICWCFFLQKPFATVHMWSKWILWKRID